MSQCTEPVILCKISQRTDPLYIILHPDSQFIVFCLSFHRLYPHLNLFLIPAKFQNENSGPVGLHAADQFFFVCDTSAINRQNIISGLNCLPCRLTEHPVCRLYGISAYYIDPLRLKIKSYRNTSWNHFFPLHNPDRDFLQSKIQRL